MNLFALDIQCFARAHMNCHLMSYKIMRQAVLLEVQHMDLEVAKTVV